MQVTNTHNNPYIFVGKTSRTQNAGNTTEPIFNNGNKKDTVSFSVENDSSELMNEFEKIKDEQGLVGKVWDGFKNIFGFKASSNKVEEKIKAYQDGKISLQEAQSALEKYKEGQKTALDVVADMASGIVAVGAFAAAVPTGGMSLVAGLGLATGAGIGVKVGVKAGDALLTGREYTGKDLAYDSATGAINGLFAPVTNGIGASVTKTVGKKLGLRVVKEGTEELVEAAAKQGIKSVITQQAVDVAGGTTLKRAAALGLGMAADGAISGAADNMTRAALNGEDVLKAGAQGAVGGLIMAPVIGGGFRLASKAGKALNNKVTTRNIFADGMNTAYKQGETGDCALLSMLDGMMKNTDTQDKIKKSITKSIGGDYQVNIGGRTVTVAKSALSDEMLSDTTGIKIFEAAYKQLGDIDGGFADDIARQFGLKPIHIASDAITDETLDKIASEKGTVLSLGKMIQNEDGTTSRHYFSIQSVDTQAKKVTVADPYDTAKLIELDYDDITKNAISIDGGSIGETSLPTSARKADELGFFGKKARVKTAPVDADLLKGLEKAGLSADEFQAALKTTGSSMTSENIAAKMDTYGISTAEFISLFESYKNSNLTPQEAIQSIVNTLEVYPGLVNSPYFTPFKISLAEADDIYKNIIRGKYSGVSEVLEGINPDMAIECVDMLPKDGDFFSASAKELQKLVSFEDYSVIDPSNLADLGRVNGTRKSVIFPNSSAAANIKVKPEDIDVDALIMSNMMTKDLIDISGEFLPQGRTTLNIFGAGSVTTDFADIYKKVQTGGFESLTSYEVHALTDSFKSMYRKNPAFKSLVDSHVKANSGDYAKIFQYVKFMQQQGQSALKRNNVTISDHALIRMLDRNMASIFDSSQARYLTFEEVIEQLAQSAKKGNTTLNIGNQKIKMILKGNNIDTVMLQ